jgi:Family of unknown function (DUF5681)
MAHDDKRDYEVGYGKPPRHTRFKRGQSGNPRGRHPGARNLSTALNEALNERVVVTENGGRRRITKRDAALKQLATEAAKGNWRAVKLLVDVLQNMESRSEPPSEENAFSPTDEKIMARLKTRLRYKE